MHYILKATMKHELLQDKIYRGQIFKVNLVIDFEEELVLAKRVIINGPMGMFEDSKYASGTKKILKILDKNKIKTVVGGGDTASAVNKLGFEDSFYHVSTGGGATMKYLEDGTLIGIEVIEDGKEEN